MDDARRSRFLKWFNGPPLNGSRQALMLKTGFSKGRVSQILNDAYPFTEIAARNIAMWFGLSTDYFEGDRPKPQRRRAADVFAVTPKDFQLLNAVKLVLSSGEQQELLAQAERLRAAAAHFAEKFPPSASTASSRHRALGDQPQSEAKAAPRKRKVGAREGD